MESVPSSLWNAIRHGDVIVDGLALHGLGSRQLVGYLHPSGLLSLAHAANTSELPGLSIGGIDVIDQLLARATDDLVRFILYVRARIETALAANQLALARDACDEASTWLAGRHRTHLKTMRDAGSLASLLLARGIDSRHFLEQIRQHPRAELLLIEAI